MIAHYREWLLAAILAGRFEALSQFGDLPNHSVQFREADPFGSIIETLFGSQNLADTAVKQVREIAAGLAGDLVGRARGELVQTVNTQIQLNLKDGIFGSEAERRILKRIDNAGFTLEKPYLVEVTNRTLTNVGYGMGERAAYEDPTIADIIWGFRYVATHDDRARPNHLALDGTTLPKNHPWWSSHWPGAWDWQCRCTHEIVYADEQPTSQTPPGWVDYPDGTKRRVGKGLDLDIKKVAKALSPAA